METPISKRKSYYEYIKKEFNPGLIYYPGSGFDKFPKEFFGIHNVIHLSLPEEEKGVGYLKLLGDGIKIMGNMEESPLASGSVDMILLHMSTNLLNKEKVVFDFNRVLKSDGIISIEGHGWTDKTPWDDYREWFKDFKEINLPDSFSKPLNLIGVKKADDSDARYINSEQEMIDFVTSNEGYIGFNEMLYYLVFQKA